MKKNSLYALGLIMLSAWQILSTNDPLPIGSPMPKANIQMQDISDQMIALNQAKTKKGLLVMFSCNTCPIVIKNQERTKNICQLAVKKGIGVILLNANEAYRQDDDSFDAMKAYAKAQDYQWYYAIDKNSVLADAFGATRTPECFLFNDQGILVYHGAIDDNPTNPTAVSRQHLSIAIDEMLSGKSISVTTSRSIGCSIKRL